MRTAKRDLTQKRLKELVHYDPDTGIFTRRINWRGGVKAGDVMGSDNGREYLQVCVAGRKYLLHRLAFLYMLGHWPPEQVDHVNHKRADNRWKNLRLATHTENHHNRSRIPSNTSGYTGVSWHTPAKKWYARIKINGKTKYLGLFAKRSEAITARQAANIRYGFHANHGK